jgi:hypothetical protein
MMRWTPGGFTRDDICRIVAKPAADERGCQIREIALHRVRSSG